MNQNTSILSVTKETICKNSVLSLGLFLTITASLSLSVLPPLVLEKMINSLTNQKQLLFQTVFLYFLLLALSGFFNTAKESMITVFGQKVTHLLRTKMSQKLNQLPASYFIKREPGVTVSLFVNDVNAVERLFSSGIVSLAVDMCKLITILLVIYWKNPGVALLLTLVTPLLFAMTRLFQKRMRKAQIENRIALGKTNQQILDTVENVRTIRMLQQEDFMKERYGKSIDLSYQAQERSNFYDAIYSPILVTVSALLVGIMMASASQSSKIQLFFGMTAGTAAAIISYIGTFFDPLENIGMEIQNIQSSMAGIQRIMSFLNETELEVSDSGNVEEPSFSFAPEKSVAAKEKRAKPTATALSLSHVSFRYAKEEPEILHDFSLSIPEGKTYLLAGRTGAGKSTIIKLMAGLYPPEKGSVTIFGKNPASIKENEKRRWFGYVEQQFCPVPGTIAQQISLGDPAISREEVLRVLEKTGLWQRVKELPAGMDTVYTENIFSQGQSQLLSIARAIVQNPKVLLLDEITANLDASTEQQILKMLNELSQHQTIVSVFHRMYDQEALKQAQIIHL